MKDTDTQARIKEVHGPLLAIERLLNKLHPGYEYKIIPYPRTNSETMFALVRQGDYYKNVWVAGVSGYDRAVFTFGAIVRGIKLEKMFAAKGAEDIEGALEEIENA